MPENLIDTSVSLTVADDADRLDGDGQHFEQVCTKYSVLCVYVDTHAS